MDKEQQINNEKIRVLLVDDHAMLRKGMALLLNSEDDIEIIGEASDGDEAIEQVRSLRPDIVVMDISMPKLNGIEATRQIVAESPDSKIIALSIHSAKSFVDDMLNAGASGYLLKESVPEELLHGIRAVMKGNMYLSSAITGKVVSAYVEGMSREQAEAETYEDVNFLQTKLQKPSLTTSLISRKQILERLDAQRSRAVTLVSAPAGYGKSTLISAWLETCDWPSAWLSLDEGDNNIRQFMGYFIAAIDNIVPGCCENTLKLLNTSKLSPTSALSPSLSNELAKLDHPFIMVLDNYQAIAVHSPVNELLQELLIHPPLPLHLVIITRSDPPLNLLTLRVKNQLTELRMLDMKLSISEVRTLLKKSAKFIPSEEALANLQNRMEGWIVGVLLVIKSLRHHKNPNEFLINLKGGFQQTQEYLAQEVITHQSPQMQDCLLKTSIVDIFCPSLCDAICGIELNSESEPEFNGEIFIEELVSENLFALPLNAEGNQFRYQHFFKHLLQQELKKRLKPDQIGALYLLASEWFESEGFIDEAIQYAYAAQHIELMADIIERHARVIINEGKRWYLVRKWLSQLPEEVIQARPELLWANLWVLYRELNTSALPPILDRIDGLMGGDTKTHAMSGEVAVFRGLCAFLENDSTRALKYIEKSLYLSKATNNTLHRVLAEFLFGLAGQMDGQMERVRHTLTKWLNDTSSLNPIRETNLTQILVAISYIDANPSETGPLLQRGRQVAKSSGLTSLNRLNDYLDGLFHLQWGELEIAVQLFEEALDGKYFHDIRGAVDAMCALSLTYQALGQEEQANKTLQSLRKHINNSPTFFGSLADFCEARLALMQGRPQDAIRSLRSSTPPPPEVMIFWFEVPCITYCRVLIAEGSPANLKQAEQQLGEYAEMNEAHHNNCQLIGILALQAVACDKQNKTNDALSLLEKALKLAQSGSFTFAFQELGKPMTELLHRYTEQNGMTDFIQQVLEGIATLENKPLNNVLKNTASASTIITEPLTNRELDILKLLTQRLQNKEIAAKLFVSNETVKTHLKHLYQKLNVHSRREAIAKAAGILNEKVN